MKAQQQVYSRGHAPFPNRYHQLNIKSTYRLKNIALVAEIFGRDRTVVSRNIRSVFNEDELKGSMLCTDFAHTNQ